MPRDTAPPIFAAAPQRILIIKPSAIGDVVHTLPILNLLRTHWPNAHISWLITPACAGLLEGHPQLNELILFDRKLFGTGYRSPRALWEFWQFGKILREKNFDLVIDLQGLFRSGFLTWITAAPFRIGATTHREFSWMFATHLALMARKPRHAIDRYLAIAEFLGLGKEPVKFIFPTDDADRQYVAALLPPEKKFAVLFPAANWETKRWPVQNFAALVAPLKERFGLDTIVAGGADAAALASQIPGTLNLGGKTTLRHLVALLERADLVIANDTGPMHVAAALGRPLVTLFGPTDPVKTGPYLRMDSVVRTGIWCSPCLSRKCWHQSCLQQMGIEAVLTTAAQQLQKPLAGMPLPVVTTIPM